MAFALAYDKLWSVHLNDQNGLKFDQDRAFGSVNLRRAFDQVLVLDDHRFYEKGVVGLDVKALRTQPADLALKHLINSRDTFLWLVERVRSSIVMLCASVSRRATTRTGPLISPPMGR